MRVILIRHGETEWNQARRLQGQVDIPLSPAGKGQVALLRPLIQHLAPTHVVISALSRAADTADVLGLQVNGTEPRLNEAHLGEWEGVSSAELKAAGPEYAAWRAGRFDPPGAEPHEIFRTRIREGFDAVVAGAASHDTVAIITHGGVVRGLLAQLVGLDPARAVPSHPASVTLLDVNGDEVKLRLYNYAGDLPLGDPAD